MNNGLEILRAKLSKLHDSANERTLYPLICEFIQNHTSKDFGGPYIATSEESLSAEDKNIGFPDITVRKDNGRLVGWWELKLRSDSLSKDAFIDQFTKYKDSLENILFTNLKEWQLWQWDSEGKPQKVDELNFDVLSFGIGEEKKLENLLIKFYEGRPFEARTPKQLALALARKTRLLSKQVEEAYDEGDKKSDLVKLKGTFEKTLIQNISVHQFSNMIAETLAYSLFLAFLEHIHRGNSAKITLQTAIEYLPTNVPVLKDLYELINKVSSTVPAIYKASLALLEQLEASDIKRIYQKLVEHKPGEDPVIQFYEPFLKEYDPKEREARGVFYTPKPVVDYIVRSVDWILRNKFGKKDKGLADESVQLLDPATGTGTFLMSAIQEIHQNINKENKALGKEMVNREFNRVVLNHILKHFYGFELMIAPYAIAHLKLTLEIERLGFDFALTKSDEEPDNDRFKVYLANTLDNPDQVPQDFFGFNSIPQESEQARLVKKDIPILAIIGNPPYSGISQNPVETTIDVSSKKGKEKSKKKIIKTWIGDLIEDYKYTEGNRLTGVHFGEKKHWLGDDYVKFIRFSHWKIEQNGFGIIALVTNDGFLDNTTLRGMRYQLTNTFDEIYTLDLHGNSKRTSDHKGDENIFESVYGVGASITFFIKYPNTTKKQFLRSDLFGSRKSKWDYLASNNIQSTKWEVLQPQPPNYYLDFIKEDQAYNSWPQVNKIFNVNSTGIQTSRDGLVVDFDKTTLLEKIKQFSSEDFPESEARLKFFKVKNSSKYLPGDTRGWKLSEARKLIAKNDHDDLIRKYNYRPFEYRYIYYSKDMVDWPRTEVMRNLDGKNNLALLIPRQLASMNCSHFFITNTISDMCVISDKTKEANVVFPLYIYKDNDSLNQLNVFSENNIRTSNLSLEFTNQFSKLLGLSFLPDGSGDLDNHFGPEDVIYYAYAIFHSPNYRSKYSEEIRKGFPRLPLTSNRELFRKLVGFGKELVQLHLLGENPFDKTKTIFDDNSKWGITPKTTNSPEIKLDWKVDQIKYEEIDKKVFVNTYQYFDGVDKEVWEFMIGGYQVCDKWLKDMKKTKRSLSNEDIKHFIKICVSLRETIRVMKEIDQAIPSWPLK